MQTLERAVVYECLGQRCIGIIHPVEATTGVVIVVGGPQYRVGSHRQFLLLARSLASNGVPVFRFDYRGMGDSEGDIRSFEAVADDIKAAIDTFFSESPGLQSVVLWGLCDAASAALFYGQSDSRVTGLVLLNPWVRTEAGQAKAYLKHYYLQRLLDKSFWQKVLSGKFNMMESVSSLFSFIKTSRSGGNAVATNAEVTEHQQVVKAKTAALPERMLDGLKSFTGHVGIIISGDDLTAAEFEDMVKASRAWQKTLKLKQVEFHRLPEANHTFSRKVWRDEVAERTLSWVKR